MHELPKLSTLYGASLGRRGAMAEPEGKVYLRRVPLDSGGYDRGGAYWGIGAPLYWAHDAEFAYEQFFRARDRAAAKAVVRADFPGVAFWR